MISLLSASKSGRELMAACEKVHSPSTDVPTSLRVAWDDVAWRGVGWRVGVHVRMGFAWHIHL